MLEPVRVGIGESIDVRFRCSLITPYDWYQASQIEFFVARMEVFSNTILLWAYPEPV